jgi:hypothetical protein
LSRFLNWKNSGVAWGLPLLAQSERQPDAEGYPPSGVKRT